MSFCHPFINAFFMEILMSATNFVIIGNILQTNHTLLRWKTFGVDFLDLGIHRLKHGLNIVQLGVQQQLFFLVLLMGSQLLFQRINLRGEVFCFLGLDILLVIQLGSEA